MRVQSMNHTVFLYDMVFLYNISSIIATVNILASIPHRCIMILEVIQNDFFGKTTVDS